MSQALPVFTNHPHVQFASHVMGIATLLDLVAETDPGRCVVACAGERLTAAELRRRSQSAAHDIQERGVARVVYIAESSLALPIALFASAYAGVPFVPLNYRLADDRLRAQLAEQRGALVVGDVGLETRAQGVPELDLCLVREFFELSGATAKQHQPSDTDNADAVAVLLYTSGTSGTPKAAVLRHRHLAGYVLGSVDMLSAAHDEVAVSAVPPYHIAGISAILTSVFRGRLLVMLPTFAPHGWVETVRSESVTHAMLVPTMLGRVLDVIDPATGGAGGLPSLRHLSYGGGRMPVPVVERALRLLDHVDFVNAYGLTETSSSISMLLPDEHREALASQRPEVRRRLGSVGRPLPIVDVSIRDPEGVEVPAGTTGEIFVRGEQVSGEYAGRSQRPRSDWFATNDAGRFDAAGYLYVEGRLDDVIVRGAENLSPGEIEDVLIDHVDVVDAAVLGVPDDEWGEVPVAVVVLRDGAAVDGDDLVAHVVARLRSSRRLAQVFIRDDLPYGDTGKVLRRVLRAELAGFGAGPGDKGES